MQAVPASAGMVVVENRMRVIASKEPSQALSCPLDPALLSRAEVGLRTCLDQGHRLNRLLVKAGAFAGSLQPAMVANQTHRSVGRDLKLQEPLQRLEPLLKHLLIGQPLAAED